MMMCPQVLVLGTEMSSTTLLALLPLFVLLAGLVIYALVDLVRAPSVRYMPKVVWALVILLGSAPFGPLAYLFFGRSRDDASASVAERGDGRKGLTGRRLSRYERGLRL